MFKISLLSIIVLIISVSFTNAAYAAETDADFLTQICTSFASQKNGTNQEQLERCESSGTPLLKDHNRFGVANAVCNLGLDTSVAVHSRRKQTVRCLETANSLITDNDFGDKVKKCSDTGTNGQWHVNCLAKLFAEKDRQITPPEQRRLPASRTSHPAQPKR